MANLDEDEVREDAVVRNSILEELIRSHEAACFHCCGCRVCLFVREESVRAKKEKKETP